MKKIYEKPLSELYPLQPEGALLTVSTEPMNPITGSWDSDADYDED